MLIMHVKINAISIHTIVMDEFDQFIIYQMDQLPLRASTIARATAKDEYLGDIVQLLEMGKNLQKAGYTAPEQNYRLTAGCLSYDHRIVIPASLKKKYLTTSTKRIWEWLK